MPFVFKVSQKRCLHIRAGLIDNGVKMKKSLFNKKIPQTNTFFLLNNVPTKSKQANSQSFHPKKHTINMRAFLLELTALGAEQNIHKCCAQTHKHKT